MDPVKRAVVEAAQSWFKEGREIEGVDDYEAFEFGELALTVRVVNNEPSSPRYFEVRVKESI